MKHPFALDRGLAGSAIRIGLLFILLIGLVYFTLYQHFQHQSDESDAVFNINNQLYVLEQALIDQETAGRGYDLTGDGVFLRAFHRGTAMYQQVSQTLLAESTLSPQTRKLMEEVIREGFFWHNRFAARQLAVKQHHGSVSNTDIYAGKQYFDHIGAQFRQLHNQVSLERINLQRHVLCLITWVFNSLIAVTLLLGIALIAAVNRHIIKHKRDQEDLRITKDTLDRAQRIAHVGSWEWDLENDVRIWSDEMYRITGLSPDMFGGTSSEYLQVIHPADRASFEEAVQRSVNGNLPFETEYRVIRPDGSIRVVHTHGELGYNKQGQPTKLFGIMQDITERRETEALMRKSEKLSVVGQLAAGIAHEVRNPLTALKGFVKLLPSASVKSQAQYLDIMREELNRIEFIVGEFLVLARPQAVQCEEIDLQKSLQDVVTLLSSQALMHNVDIETHFADDVPPIHCEGNQIKQVFVNIIKNAIEAMPIGGTIHVLLSMERDEVLIRFVDEGHGISHERLATLGEPFYTTKEKGTGLGLMVSKKIIDHHNGRLAITSTIGKGTEVSVYLPAAVAQTLLG